MAIITTLIKSLVFVYDNGWDGIAGILGGLMLGALIGLILSLIILKKIPEKKLGIWVLLLIVLNAIPIILLGLRS